MLKVFWEEEYYDINLKTKRRAWLAEARTTGSPQVNRISFNAVVTGSCDESTYFQTPAGHETKTLQKAVVTSTTGGWAFWIHSYVLIDMLVIGLEAVCDRHQRSSTNGLLFQPNYFLWVRLLSVLPSSGPSITLTVPRAFTQHRRMVYKVQKRRK